MKKRFAVMGNPIAHSLSPYIHQRFAELLGIQLDYEKILIAEESNFEEEVRVFFDKGGKGLNITLPFKQNAFTLAARKTERCTQAKAANTLWVNDNELWADNTDGIGLIRDLSTHVDLSGKQVLLLGAGGAARGIVGPLLAGGIASMTLVNRNQEKAKNLQSEYKQIQCLSMEELKTSYDLVINATSASLSTERMALSPFILKSTTLCYDLAYSRTDKTTFVKWASEQGVVGIDGLGMLVEQAAESFYIWHGIRPDSAKVLQELKSSQI
ncbi:MAG: shikimate dehydrogenase [Tatlockia sp.]|nr:shikimate dehydrogenase [Tatlockia sp.]